MDKNSFSALSVTLKDKQYKSEIEIEFSSVKNKLSIIPIQTLQKDKTYLLHIDRSVKDIAGNPLNASYSAEFLCVVPTSHISSKELDAVLNKEKNTSTEFNLSIQTTPLNSGKNHTLALKDNGVIIGWGENEYGQTTNAKKKITKKTTKEQTNSNNWKSLSAGAKHSNAIKTDGTLWSWGKNDSGELGDGTNISSNTQVQESSQSSWLLSSAGENHTLAIKVDGTLWAWGNNYYGQLGDGTTKNRNTPTQIGQNTWQAISAGQNFSIGIQSDGTLWAWGINDNYQLGLKKNTKNKLIPTQIK